MIQKDLSREKKRKDNREGTYEKHKIRKTLITGMVKNIAIECRKYIDEKDETCMSWVRKRVKR